MAKCPHCRKTIDPPPTRSRKCPHCRERIELRKGRLLTPDAAEAIDDKATAAEAKQRFREGRKNGGALRKLKERRKSLSRRNFGGAGFPDTSPRRPMAYVLFQSAWGTTGF